MTADHQHLEQRLRSALAEQPSVAGAAMLDVRLSALMTARPRASEGGTPVRTWRSPWAMAAAAVVFLVAAAAGGVWLSTRLAAPVPVASAPAGVLLGSPSPSTSTSSFAASPIPEAATLATHEPLPSQDSAKVTDSLEGTTEYWWSPGRALGRFGRQWRSPDDMIQLVVHPPETLLELRPRPGGVVRIISRGFADGDPDPLACLPDSVGRYRVAKTDDRLDLEPLSDPCAARVQAVAGTWQAVGRWFQPATLFVAHAIGNLEGFRIDRIAAGASVEGEAPVDLAVRIRQLNDGRDGDDGIPAPRRAFDIHRPDASVRLGFPIRSLGGTCQGGADPRADVSVPSIQAAIDELRTRPGISVLGIAKIPAGTGTITRVDVAAYGDPAPCAVPTLFDTLDIDDRPIWPVPAPANGQTASAVYLAAVPGSGGGEVVVAMIVLPPEKPADVQPEDADMIVAQVLTAIDWKPQLHPPAWPAEP